MSIKQSDTKIFHCHSNSHLIGFENTSTNNCIWSFILPYQDEISSIDGIITTQDFPLRYDDLKKMPNLKVISSYGVTYDYIDIHAASELGILVTNTPNSVTRATAELGISLILASIRNLVEHDRLIRSKNFPGFANENFKYPILSHDFSSQAIGIIGFGRIGKTVYDLTKKLGFETSYYHPHGPLKEHSGYKEMPELLATSDVVVLCTPLNQDTYHLINDKSFEFMKSSAKIVNIGQGSCIDESSLIRALKTHRISGAALDVFEYEPRISQELIEMDQVILSPHTGSATLETKKAMTAEAIENLVQALNKTPQNAINLDFWTRKEF